MTEDNKLQWEVVDEKPADKETQPAETNQAEASTEQPAQEEKKDTRFDRRIRSLVRRAKTAEEHLAAANERASKFEDELGQLRETVTRMQAGNVQNVRQSIEREYVAARERLRAAKEAADPAAEVAATEAMLRAQSQWNNLPRENVVRDTPPKEAERPQPQQARQDDMHPKVKEWINSRDWWETDDVAKAAAIAIAGRLEREGELTADDDEYYATIDRQLAKRFPELYPEAKTKEAPRQTVSGGSRVSQTNDGRTKVALTKSQLDFASKLGLTPEQYALEVKKMSDATQNGRVGPIEITVPGRK